MGRPIASRRGCCRRRTPLLARFEEVAAPGDRVSKRLLTGRQIPRAAGQERQAPFDPGKDCLWCEQADACCCQLDRQRQPIKAVTDLRHGCRVLFGDHEVRLDRRRAFDEEGRGREPHQRVGRRWSVPIGQHEGSKSISKLTSEQRLRNRVLGQAKAIEHWRTEDGPSRVSPCMSTVTGAMPATIRRPAEAQHPVFCGSEPNMKPIPSESAPWLRLVQSPGVPVLTTPVPILAFPVPRRYQPGIPVTAGSYDAGRHRPARCSRGDDEV